MYETPVNWYSHDEGGWESGWIRLLDANSVPTGMNPFGNVSSAYISVECIVFSVIAFNNFLWDIPTKEIAPGEDGPALRIGKLLLDDES